MSEHAATIVASPPGVTGAKVSAAKEVFRGGRTKPLSWRRDQLEGLIRMVTESAADIEAAVHSDLGKNEVEAYLTEVSSVASEARLALKNLRRWTRDRRVRTPLSLGTSRAWIQREPLGTVLIIGQASSRPPARGWSRISSPGTSIRVPSKWSKVALRRPPNCSGTRSTIFSTLVTARSDRS
jgi:hypothetical protein